MLYLTLRIVRYYALNSFDVFLFDCFDQDITIRRLEDVIAEFEERSEAKVEQEAEARSKALQEVRGVPGGCGGGEEATCTFSVHP